MQHVNQQADQGTKKDSSAVNPFIQRSGLSAFVIEAIQRNEEVSQTNLQPSDVTTLQSAIGNKAVQRMLIQPKLKVGAANDEYEREADHIARQVVDGPRLNAPAQGVQRKVMVQRRATEDGFDADSNFENQLNRTKGAGQPLPDKTRANLEPKFGSNFGNVRIHTNSASNQLSRSIQAKAFTHGNDIHFGAGEYNPGSNEGKKLLAHELTHTIQQTGGGNVQRTENVAHLTVQRKLNFAQTELQGTLTKTAKFKGLFGKQSTFAQLQSELAHYQEADGPAEELASLTVLKELAGQWLTKHGSERNKDIEKEASVTKLINEITREIPLANARIQGDADEQEEYVRQVESKSLKYLTSGGISIAKQMKGWVAGTGAMSKQGTNAHALSKTHNLSLAEASAIGIYTADDYKYMNPAMAKNRGWMKAMLPRLGVAKSTVAMEIGTGVTDTHVDEATVEGQLHGKIAKSGMKKLPNWIGTTYRGLALPEAQFSTDYPLRGVTSFAAFSSTSKNIGTSRAFASNEAKGDNVAILCQLQLTKGKDIAALSNSPGEAEILLMPGATFRIAKIAEEQYKGKKMYVVTMQQEK